MILEAMISAALGGAVYGYIESRREQKEEIELEKEKIEQLNNINTWKKCLELSDTKGIRNKIGETFLIEKYIKTDYGFLAKVKAPLGCDWMALKNVGSEIETAFKGTVEIKKDKYSDYIDIEVITKKPEFVFSPIKTNCNEWFGGLKANGEPYLISLDENPHVCYTGTTGTGKTFTEFVSVTNLLYNYKNDFEVYITQLINGETKIFSKCKPVKLFADTLEEALVILRQVAGKADARAKELNKYGYVSVKHWNDENPDKAFKRIILLMDEFSFFKVEEGDSEEVKKFKNECEIYLKRIAKTGRAMAISIVMVLQKSTVENVNSTIRSQMCVISLRQFSGQDSKVAIGTTEAARLNEFEAIIKGNGIYEKVFIPRIKSKQPQIHLAKYVPEIVIPKKGVILKEKIKEIPIEEKTNNIIVESKKKKIKKNRNVKGA
ncbi:MULTISPECIES: hypothetical protein [Clostridium]|uniref:hypothetical protein n=1 Tax=Clostridium TaxID=1485 RepID=UPI001E36709D|nr:MULTISPECIES: hypothetical protein [Clostridium]MCC5432678.1 hypothetical protein [Clostridium perfringens]MCC5435522.1 hypothetical protein [Clostridium perfringens]MCC5444632.1 hypothetical protein [Clostridium perfringens]MCC5448285.1 hypothetical protein [Clostridium perfringens]MDU4427619.1 hypothetical protein [Clostridium sp.]